MSLLMAFHDIRSWYTGALSYERVEDDNNNKKSFDTRMNLRTQEAKSGSPVVWTSDAVHIPIRTDTCMKKSCMIPTHMAYPRRHRVFIIGGKTNNNTYRYYRCYQVQIRKWSRCSWFGRPAFKAKSEGLDFWKEKNRPQKKISIDYEAILSAWERKQGETSASGEEHSVRVSVPGHRGHHRAQV